MTEDEPIDRHADAEGTHQRTLGGPVKSLGLTHRIILRSRCGLALVSVGYGKASRAELLNRKAHQGWEKLRDPEDLDTIISLGSLANPLFRREKISDADVVIQCQL